MPGPEPEGMDGGNGQDQACQWPRNPVVKELGAGDHGQDAEAMRSDQPLTWLTWPATANTTYKAMQRSAQVVRIGPMLQGLVKPVNDLSRGAWWILVFQRDGGTPGCSPKKRMNSALASGPRASV